MVLLCKFERLEIPLQSAEPSVESLRVREASTVMSPLHPTNQRGWFQASHESAHTAGMSVASVSSRLSSLAARLLFKKVPAMHASQIFKKKKKNFLKISKFGKLPRLTSSHLICSS